MSVKPDTYKGLFVTLRSNGYYFSLNVQSTLEITTPNPPRVWTDKENMLRYVRPFI